MVLSSGHGALRHEKAFSMARDRFSFFATTPKGMEPLLAQELTELGAEEVQATLAGASFRGTLKTAYRVCLWSRMANRVLMPIKKYEAHTPDHLYEGALRIRWSTHLPPDATLAVDFTSAKSAITHTQFGAQRIKDAVVDQLREERGTRPSVDLKRPDVRINVRVYQSEVTVSIDLSGDSLHRRGYREDGANAPLKENLADAILRIAGWKEAAAQGAGFLDPMCGSGTLPLAAALIALNRAPGLDREFFGFFGWARHEPAIWGELIDEARELELKDPKRFPRIVGTDQDAFAIRSAWANAERARLTQRVHFERREVMEAAPWATASTQPAGIVVVNPPYGERLGEEESLKPLYSGLGDLFKQRFKGWRGYILTGSPELAKVVGLKAARRHPLFNGAIECRLLQYELY